MICEGNFVYKAIEKKDGGKFTNERGQEVSYEPSYRVIVDEQSNEGKISQRFFKFPQKDTGLFEKFKNFKPYTSIIISFDVELYQSSVKLIPIDVTCEHEEVEE